MDTTDFMQKLSRHAQQTGELMEEAVRQMEMLQEQAKGFQELFASTIQTNTAMGKKLLQMQAELEQAKAERDAQSNGIHKICKICLLDKYYDCARRIKEG